MQTITYRHPHDDHYDQVSLDPLGRIVIIRFYVDDEGNDDAERPEEIIALVSVNTDYEFDLDIVAARLYEMLVRDPTVVVG